VRYRSSAVNEILYIEWTFVRGSFVGVRRIFLDGPVYGEGSVFCSLFALSHTHQRGEEDHGHGHGHHEKDARRDTNDTPVCCCELIAPLANTRIARAPELVILQFFQEFFSEFRLAQENIRTKEQ
jgi:hypothetical protein